MVLLIPLHNAAAEEMEFQDVLTDILMSPTECWLRQMQSLREPRKHLTD